MIVSRNIGHLSGASSNIGESCSLAYANSTGDFKSSPIFRHSIPFKSRCEFSQCLVDIISLNKSNSRSEGPASKSSYLLGDPPPGPRFLASRRAVTGRA
jgi:hypothetical protein